MLCYEMSIKRLGFARGEKERWRFVGPSLLHMARLNCAHGVLFSLLFCFLFVFYVKIIPPADAAV